MTLADLFRDERRHADPVLVIFGIDPDPDLAARNAARIEEAKARLGDKYVCAKPINAKEDK